MLLNGFTSFLMKPSLLFNKFNVFMLMYLLIRYIRMLVNEYMFLAILLLLHEFNVLLIKHFLYYFISVFSLYLFFYFINFLCFMKRYVRMFLSSWRGQRVIRSGFVIWFLICVVWRAFDFKLSDSSLTACSFLASKARYDA